MSLKDEMNLDIYVEEKADEALTRKRFTEGIIAAFGFLAALAVFYISQLVAAIIAGSVFLVIGIMELQYNKKHNAFPEKYVMPLIFEVLGLAFGVVPLIGVILLHTVNPDNEQMTLFFAFFEGILALIFGIMVTGYPIFYAVAKKRRCTCRVTATCVTPVIIRSTKGNDKFFEHIWEFQLNGSTERVSDKIWVTTEKPYAGTIESFLVNPDDPHDLYRKMPFLSVYMMIFGIIVCVIAIMVVFSSFVPLWH